MPERLRAGHLPARLDLLRLELRLRRDRAGADRRLRGAVKDWARWYRPDFTGYMAGPTDSYRVVDGLIVDSLRALVARADDGWRPSGWHSMLLMWELAERAAVDAT